MPRALRGQGHHVTRDLTRCSRPGSRRRERQGPPPRVSAARSAGVLAPAPDRRPAVPGTRGAPGGSSARLGRLAGRVWSEPASPQPARGSRSDQRRLGGFPAAASLRPGSCGSGASSARGPRSRAAGAGMPLWSPRLAFCPGPLGTARPRGPALSGPLPGAGPTSCQLLLCSAPQSPLENAPEGGALGPAKAFLSLKGQPPAHLVLIRAQGETWPGACRIPEKFRPQSEGRVHVGCT